MIRLVTARVIAVGFGLALLGASLTGCGKKEEVVNPTATDAGKATQYRSTYGSAPKSAAGGDTRSYGSRPTPPGPVGR